MNKNCIKCKKKVRRFYDDFLCWDCYSSGKSRMPYNCLRIGLKEALDKIRIVRGARVGKSFSGRISVPSVLIGKKVKLVLVKDGSNER